MRRRMIAVIGSGAADDALTAHAEDVGAAIAVAGFAGVCGGLGGVMSAACRGAVNAPSGPTPRTVAILPGTDTSSANAWAEVVIATGIGHARNLPIVLSADAVVAVGGGAGTLSEIAHSWQEGRRLAAYLPAGGWGEKIAGMTLDPKRPDSVVGLADERALAHWLDSLLCD